jgi:predicted dehydrogenase
LSLDEAVREKSFLGFTVATPAATHYLLAKKIIEAGKHVYGGKTIYPPK